MFKKIKKLNRNKLIVDKIVEIQASENLLNLFLFEYISNFSFILESSCIYLDTHVK